MTEPSYPNGNTLAYRVAELERDMSALAQKQKDDVKELGQKVDRLMWSLVSLTIALTTTTVMLLLTRIVEQAP